MIAESFERIHRSNLLGMGILPLQFKGGENADKLGLKGTETFTIAFGDDIQIGQDITVSASSGVSFTCRVRLDTDPEVTYFKNGGILPYVLRKLL